MDTNSNDDLESACATLSNNVYEGARLIEDLEGRLYTGNGHHARQVLTSMAELLLRCGAGSLSQEDHDAVWEVRKRVTELFTKVKNCK